MFQKYTQALSLMDAVIAVKHDNNLARAKWDELYRFIFANFAAPASTGVYYDTVASGFELEVQQAATMFITADQDRAMFESQLRKIPPVVAEVAFPVWVALSLLRYHRVHVTSESVETFYEFHNRYAFMILNGVYDPAVLAARRGHTVVAEPA